MVVITVYKPGDPEFDEIAKTITHVSSIKDKEFKGMFITADKSPPPRYHRRNENQDEILVARDNP